MDARAVEPVDRTVTDDVNLHEDFKVVNEVRVRL